MLYSVWQTPAFPALQTGCGWKPNRGKQQKVKRSNNWYRDSKKLQREYDKLDKKKEAKAIEISHQILSENRRVILQDE